MQLRSIRCDGADGLRGRKFHIDLTGVDVIVGANGDGKSTVLDALGAAFHGLAENPNDPLRTFVGPLPRASVTVEIAGRSFRRDLSKGPRTGAAKQATGEIGAIAGPRFVRWDLGNFARGTDRERQHLFDAVLRAGATRAVDDDAILSHLPDGKARTALLATLPLDAARPAEWLRSASEWAEGARKDARRERDGADKAAQRAPQSEGGISVAEAAQALSEARTAYEQAVGSLNDARATIGADAVEVARERDRLAHAVELAASKVGPEVCPAEVAATTRARLEALRVQVQAPDFPASRALRDAATDKLSLA
jgi:hypothetical protein